MEGNKNNIGAIKPRGRGKFIIVILLIAFFGGGIYYDTYFGSGIIKNAVLKSETKTTEGDKSDNSKKDLKKIMEFESDSKSSFKSFGKSFIQCTKDGVKYYSEMGNQKWNDTYTMASPIVVSEGKYTAVADVMRRTVKVYNESGVVYSVSTESSISKISLNVNGYLAVMMKDKIVIYNNEGTNIKGRSEGVANVFPMDIDISNDNRVFAVSYLDTSDIKMISRVLLFYINEDEGKDYTDKMFAAQDNIEGIIPSIGFTNKDMLIAMADSIIIAMDMSGKMIWNVEVANEISYYGFVGEQIIIAYGDVLSGKDSNKADTLELLNSKGEVSATFDVGDEITYLNTSEVGIIIGAGNDFYSVSNSGKIVWKHKSIQDVSDILPMENSNNVLYVTKNSAEIIDMAKENKFDDMKEKEKNSAKDIETENVKKDELKTESGATEVNTEGEDVSAEPKGTEDNSN